MPDCQQVGQLSAEAEADRAYLAGTGRMPAQEGQRAGGVLNSLCLVQPLIKFKGSFPPGVGLIGQLHSALLPPEQIGTDHDEAALRVPISDRTHDLIYPEDFL